MANTTPPFASLAIVADMCHRHIGLRVRHLLVRQLRGLQLAPIGTAQSMLPPPTHREHKDHQP